MLSCRYGVILKKLDLLKEAVDIFVEAVDKEPTHWGAWLELSTLCTDREMVKYAIHCYSKKRNRKTSFLSFQCTTGTAAIKESSFM